ncbi:hypothetical protein HG535_0F02430 [Zygotorulaspora mrakii]|uniref:RRM domain-containing protein n=1 Tax=Zygotorulaspora mrakii TaxID=42260 RepID=A0A7H9B7M6_ZYGMR|nr:uncharacterized protein HG535_0F02430 [Zygotorulaspora mrakii]QLG73732.1 hypothetical protein HG535_0F02430 [Zygotorulaspora mrakii]
MDKEELELKCHLKEIKKKELQRRKLEQSKRKDITEEKKYEPTAIYISNLSTKDIDEQQLINEFSKYGAIRKDQEGNVRCKLYKDSEGKLKGDALIIYVRKESVPMAIEMMDGYRFKNSVLDVKVADFENQRKRSFEPEDSDNSEKTKKQQKTLSGPRESKKMQQVSQKFEENQDKIVRSIKISNIVGIYDQLSKEELNDIKADILEGCLDFGPVEDVQLSPDSGEAAVVFKYLKDAQSCSKKMNGRFFGGRELVSFLMNEEVSSQSDNLKNYALEDDLIE